MLNKLKTYCTYHIVKERFYLSSDTAVLSTPVP